MVDFQSRDTKRGFGDDEEDEEDEEDELPDSPEETAESDPETATIDGEARTDEEQGHGHEGEHEHGHEESHGHATEHDHGPDESHSHDHHAHDVASVGTAVVTVSSTRSFDEDPSGDAIARGMEHEGTVVTRELIPDDYDRIQQTVETLANRKDVDVVVTTGGTGVTPDDVTIEAVEPLFSKELPGFGELFRILSHEEIGTKVVATRATAGVVDGTPVFCLPGSENAARLGVNRIVREEAGHLAGLASR